MPSPEPIFAAAARPLDLTRPVGVLLIAVLHFIRDSDDPYGSSPPAGLMAGRVVRMTVRPAGRPELAEPYEVIHLGGEAAAIVPLTELRRLRAVERHASPEAREEAEIEATLAAHDEWVAVGQARRAIARRRHGRVARQRPVKIEWSPAATGLARQYMSDQEGMRAIGAAVAALAGDPGAEDNGDMPRHGLTRPRTPWPTAGLSPELTAPDRRGVCWPQNGASPCCAVIVREFRRWRIDPAQSRNHR